MVKTRSAIRKQHTATRKYRHNAKSSACKGKGLYACAALKPKCSVTKRTAKKKSYCRKSRNTRFRSYKSL